MVASQPHLLWFARGTTIIIRARAAVWLRRLMLKLKLVMRAVRDTGRVIVSHIQQVVHDVAVRLLHVGVPQQLSLHLTQLRQVVLFRQIRRGKRTLNQCNCHS